jgi:hypothetical protein
MMLRGTKRERVCVCVSETWWDLSEMWWGLSVVVGIVRRPLLV